VCDDDGHFHKAENCISAPTHLSQTEVELLVSVLKENLDLVGKIHKISGKEQYLFI